MKYICKIFILFFSLSLMSFNNLEEAEPMDCDGFAEWVYWQTLSMGMGQRYATNAYLTTHADCLEGGGTSSFGN